jgi:hypothetical protein
VLAAPHGYYEEMTKKEKLWELKMEKVKEKAREIWAPITHPNGHTTTTPFDYSQYVDKCSETAALFQDIPQKEKNLKKAKKLNESLRKHISKTKKRAES